MRRSLIIVTLLLFTGGVFAGNNYFQDGSTSEWADANWSLGYLPTADHAVVRDSSTAIVPSGYTAVAAQMSVGDGIVEVHTGGTLLPGWSNIGNWTGSGGTLKILGGTYGGVGNLKSINMGAADNAGYGSFEVGTGGTGGTTYINNLNIFAPTGAGVNSAVLNSGTLNANNIYMNATTGDLGGSVLTINGGDLVLNAHLETTDGATIVINGSSAGINIGGHITFRSNTDFTFNFDDNGISAVTSGVIYCTADHTVNINIEGTENVAEGTYELFLPNAGAIDDFVSRANFNINTNSFGTKEITLIFDTDNEQILLQLVSTAAGYDLWKSTYGLTGGTTDDDDGDGLSNINEYGLGGDPTNSASLGTLPTMTVSNGVASYTHALLTDPVADVTYTVEQTTDLVNQSWSNAGWTVVSTNTTGDPDFDEVVYQIEDGSKRFFRLNITKQ